MNNYICILTPKIHSGYMIWWILFEYNVMKITGANFFQLQRIRKKKKNINNRSDERIWGKKFFMHYYIVKETEFIGKNHLLSDFIKRKRKNMYVYIMYKWKTTHSARNGSRMDIGQFDLIGFDCNRIHISYFSNCKSTLACSFIIHLYVSIQWAQITKRKCATIHFTQNYTL